MREDHCFFGWISALFYLDSPTVAKEKRRKVVGLWECKILIMAAGERFVLLIRSIETCLMYALMYHVDFALNDKHHIQWVE